MKVENQVCSLELAIKLKEIGIKQKSLFYYDYTPHVNNGKKLDKPILDYWNDLSSCPTRDIMDFVSAFTVAELGEMLPYWVQTKRLENQFELGTLSWINKCEYDWNCLIGDEQEANARAKMLIYLIENGLIKHE